MRLFPWHLAARLDQGARIAQHDSGARGEVQLPLEEQAPVLPDLPARTGVATSSERPRVSGIF